MTDHFGELLTAMATPFAQNYDVDYEGVKNLARYLIENGSDGLVVLGTTGEVPALSTEEKISVLKTVIKETGDSCKIVAGTGSYSTFESIELTEKAEELGVDGIMLVGPYYNKPPQRGLYKHFSMIAEKTSLPVMIYNVPGRTSRNIEPETIKKLSKIENIIAVKEASGDIAQISKISRMTPDDFYIYSGDDKLTLPVLSVGGQGVVSVAAHVAGNEIKEMIQAYKNDNPGRAAELNKKLEPLFSGIFIDTNPIPIKAALKMKGIEAGTLRPPLVELKDEHRQELKNILKDLDLI